MVRMPFKASTMTHTGCHTAVVLARQRFFWPYMSQAIGKKCKECERCVCRKAKAQKAPMESIVTTAPMELVCMDFLSPEPDSGGVANILVITEHFTKYAIAVPCRNQTARTVAEALWENLISHYSWCQKLHSDQGANFESKVIAELCKLFSTIYTIIKVLYRHAYMYVYATFGVIRQVALGITHLNFWDYMGMFIC